MRRRHRCYAHQKAISASGNIGRLRTWPRDLDKKEAMARAADLRLKAERMRRHAARAKDLNIRDQWLVLAEWYETLAHRYEIFPF